MPRGPACPLRSGLAQPDRQKLPARIWGPPLPMSAIPERWCSCTIRGILRILRQRKGYLRREIVQNSCIVVGVLWQVDGKTWTESDRNRGAQVLFPRKLVHRKSRTSQASSVCIWPRRLASPKSVTRGWPAASNRRFAGFRSR